MSDSKAITDYLRRYDAWRRGEDERTMDEAGIVPAGVGRIIDAAVGLLEQAPDMSRIAMRKIEQLGGEVCGVLVRNEAGALAAVSDMGRVTWLDDCVTQGDCKGECVLPGQGSEPIGYTNWAQLAYIKTDGEGAVYSDTDLGCDIALYTQPHNGEQGGEWVRCDERMPTEADADWDDDVIVFDSEGDMAVTHYGVVEQCGHPGGSITHWKPTGLKRPQPPQVGSGDE